MFIRVFLTLLLFFSLSLSVGCEISKRNITVFFPFGVFLLLGRDIFSSLNLIKRTS